MRTAADYIHGSAGTMHGETRYTFCELLESAAVVCSYSKHVPVTCPACKAMMVTLQLERPT